MTGTNCRIEPVSHAVIAAAAIVFLIAAGDPVRAAEQWNFYMHQSAPNFATSRGAKQFTEEIERATGTEGTKIGARYGIGVPVVGDPIE